VDFPLPGRPLTTRRRSTASSQPQRRFGGRSVAVAAVPTARSFREEPALCPSALRVVSASRASACPCRQVVQNAFQHPAVGAPVPEGRRIGDPVLWERPPDARRADGLDRRLPLPQRIAERRVQGERTTTARVVAGLPPLEDLDRGDRHHDEIGQAESARLQPGTRVVQLVLEPRPRCGTDSSQAPRVVQLQRVAVAEHDRTRPLERHRLLPPSGVHTRPVRGLSILVRSIGFQAPPRVLRHHRPALPRTPRGLARGARPLDGHDHVSSVRRDSVDRSGRSAEDTRKGGGGSWVGVSAPFVWGC